MTHIPAPRHAALALGLAALIVAPIASAGAPPGRYTLTADTVQDAATGLEWQRAEDGINRTQANAIGYCAALSLGGHTDWRLPTVRELRSLVDPSRVSPAIDTTAFPATPSTGFWSASPYVGASGFGWVVGFDYGGSAWSGVGSSHRVRCVR